LGSTVRWRRPSWRSSTGNPSTAAAVAWLKTNGAEAVWVIAYAAAAIA
jgi:hypothetical protein